MSEYDDTYNSIIIAVFVTLYFSGLEVIIWSYVPWELILCAVLSFLGNNSVSFLFTMISL